MAAPGRLTRSPTIDRVVNELASQPQVTAFAIVDHILQRHDDYLGDAEPRPQLVAAPPTAQVHPVEDWMQELESLFEPSRVSSLHGRIVVLGLGLVDRTLGAQLRAGRIEQALVAALEEPFPSLLTEAGRARWAQRNPLPPESVRTLKDRPAVIDALGRRIFAQVLAKMLLGNRAEEPEGIFFLHLGGAWGAGKSSVLNFLRDELRSETPAWVVIDFNAWQHQRTGPPWWSLLREVYLQSCRQLSPQARRALQVREWWWRSRTIEAARALPLLAVVGLLLIAIILAALQGLPGALGALAELGKSISTVLAAVAGVVAVFELLLGRGSSGAAASYVQNAQDPLATIERHFVDLTRWIRAPVVLLIDDLDRCRENYVVQLLEGMQTLFTKGAATFVVAADRRWLRACYEKEYAVFTMASREPGRPLGYLFLDKVFQLSAEVPLLSDADRAHYWQGLLRMRDGDSDAALRKERSLARVRLAKLTSEPEILHELEQVVGDDSLAATALRQEAALLLATPQLRERTEHALEDLAAFLEPNPRAMKRFVNRYGVERLTRTLEGSAVGGELALWTIVLLRWPLLAELLEDHPQLADRLSARGAHGPVDLGEQRDLASLFDDESVRRVFAGPDGGTSLGTEVLRRCIRLVVATPASPAGGAAPDTG